MPLDSSEHVDQHWRVTCWTKIPGTQIPNTADGAVGSMIDTVTIVRMNSKKKKKTLSLKMMDSLKLGTESIKKLRIRISFFFPSKKRMGEQHSRESPVSQYDDRQTS